MVQFHCLVGELNGVTMGSPPISTFTYFCWVWYLHESYLPYDNPSFIDVISYLEEGDCYIFLWSLCFCSGLAPWIDFLIFAMFTSLETRCFLNLGSHASELTSYAQKQNMDTQRGWRCFEDVECTLMFFTNTVYDMYIFTKCIYTYRTYEISLHLIHVY